MNDNPFLPALEFSSADEIKSRQDELLQKQMTYLAGNSPYYQDVFARTGIHYTDILTLEDLEALPFTTKDDLQKHNDAFLCVPRNRIVDFITTSGTLGDPVTLGATAADLDRLAYNEAISFVCAGGGPGQVYQLMTTLDRRFMAGLAYFMGIKLMGAGVIRVGSGVPELHWDSIRRFNPDTMVVVPSFILKLIDYAHEHHIDFRRSSLKSAVCIGEPLRNADFTLNELGKRITDEWDIKLFSTYASTEMATAFTECTAGMGGHHHPELLIVEVLGQDDRQVGSGEAGEVVITNLGVEGMPLLRFRTGDICNFFPEPCSCGRKTIRLGPVVGRKGQMIKYKGTTLYPPALFQVLDGIGELENYLVEVSSDSLGNDRIVVSMGLKPGVPDITEKVKCLFQGKLRVIPDFSFRPAAELSAILMPPSDRKAVKFIDKRNKNIPS